MKSLRHLFAALVLTCGLSISAFAGDMGTQGYAPGDMGTQGIATSEMGTSATATVPGDTGTDAASSADSAMGIVLNLLQSVLSLF